MNVCVKGGAHAWTSKRAQFRPSVHAHSTRATRAASACRRVAAMHRFYASHASHPVPLSLIQQPNEQFKGCTSYSMVGREYIEGRGGCTFSRRSNDPKHGGAKPHHYRRSYHRRLRWSSNPVGVVLGVCEAKRQSMCARAAPVAFAKQPPIPCVCGRSENRPARSPLPPKPNHAPLKKKRTARTPRRPP